MLVLRRFDASAKAVTRLEEVTCEWEIVSRAGVGGGHEARLIESRSNVPSSRATAPLVARRTRFTGRLVGERGHHAAVA